MIFHRLLMSTGLVFKPFITNPDPENPDYLFELEHIQASTFEESGGRGTHWYSEWQVANDFEFTDIIIDAGRDFTNKESIVVGDLGLEMLGEYYVRVRYATASDVSEWSDPVLAKTGLFASDVNDWADSILDFSFFGF